MYNRDIGYFCFGVVDCGNDVTFHVVQKVNELQPGDLVFRAQKRPVLICEKRGLEFDIFSGGSA
jgi:hypothetical protein